MPPGTDKIVLADYGTYATAFFVAGWTTGGLIFGAVARPDRPRQKTLTNFACYV